MTLSTEQAAGILIGIPMAEQHRLSRKLAREQLNAQRWHQFEATAAAWLSGRAATTVGEKSVAARLTAWRCTPREKRDSRFPRLAPLLQQSRHASLRAYYHCPDPEGQWMGVHVRGLFEGRYYEGRVVRIDRDVQVQGRILPLQLLVLYEDGDHVHLDEEEAQAQARAYYVAHRSQSRMFANLGTATLDKRQPVQTQWYCPPSL